MIRMSIFFHSTTIPSRGLWERNNLTLYTFMKILLAFLCCYVAVAFGSLLTLSLEMESLFTYNKYVFFFLFFVVAISAFNLKIKTVEFPGVLQFLFFLLIVFIHVIYPGTEFWTDSIAGLIKAYFVYIVIINLFRSQQEVDLFCKVLIGTIAVFTLVYIHESLQALYKPLTDMKRLVAEETGFYINANAVSYVAVIPFIAYNSRWFRLYLSPQSLLMFILFLSTSLSTITLNGSRGALGLFFLFFIINIINILN